MALAAKPVVCRNVSRTVTRLVLLHHDTKSPTRVESETLCAANARTTTAVLTIWLASDKSCIGTRELISLNIGQNHAFWSTIFSSRPQRPLATSSSEPLLEPTMSVLSVCKARPSVKRSRRQVAWYTQTSTSDKKTNSKSCATTHQSFPILVRCERRLAANRY